MGRVVIGGIVEQSGKWRKLLCVVAVLALGAGCKAPPAPEPAQPPTPAPADPDLAPPPTAPADSQATPAEPRGEEPPQVGATPCQRKLDAAGVGYRATTYKPRSPEGHPDLVCGVDDPVWVAGTVHGVAFLRGRDKTPSRMLASCDLAVALGRLALQARKQGVTQIIHAGTTQCRPIGDSARLSQHAYGRAIDILGFRTERHHTWSVKRDWEHDAAYPQTPKGKALHTFAERMHEDFVFNIVLTPEYNEAHADHFHLDLTPDRHYLSRGAEDLLLGD